MLAFQYTHSLDDAYDMSVIDQRVAERGPLWDGAERLVFKAFIARRRGSQGATGNAYASLYVWQDIDAATDFITDNRFNTVIEAFGRPRIETWLPLNARRGNGAGARSLYREEFAIAEGVKLQALREVQRELNQSLVGEPDVVAVVTVLDPYAWRLLRFTLHAGPLSPNRAGQGYEVLHLAMPGLAQLS